MKAFVMCAVLAGVFTPSLFAAAKLPHVFGDNMVLQQGQKVPVWGSAEPGETVTVSFAGQSVSATADKSGKWKLFLSPLKASSKGRDFKVSSGTRNSQLSTLSFGNVVVGEVWFCAGQSNMEYPMCGFALNPNRRIKDAEREVAAANHPLLRHFKVPRLATENPCEDVDANWEVNTPTSVKRQSAVAYVFGETLLKELDVPVGLIDCSWGGMRIEPWIPAAHPDDRFMLQRCYGTGWKHRYEIPTSIWNGMIAGVCPFAIKGAIWYQGEANRRDGEAYIDKTVALVRGWRREWGQGDFPYFLVQLAPYKYEGLKGVTLPVIQEAQARIPDKVPNSGYTVINDVGNLNDIHPTDKRTVGMRMADQALDRVYGKFVRPWKTPVPKSFKVEGSKFRVVMENANGLKTRDGLPPNEFEVRGLSTDWTPATAVIEGSDVVLSAAGVDRPVAMRFSAYNGSLPNLVNGDGLPAGPFRCGARLEIGAAEKLPELDGFTCVQRFDIPFGCDFSRKAPKTLKSISNVKRVAYLLEAVDNGGDEHFAFAAMDAFAPTSDELVLSAKPDSRLYRLPLRNLTVRSNVPGVKARDGSSAGFIEFYNSSYSPVKGAVPAAGDGRKFDCNDTPQPKGVIGYGCLQIHDLEAKSTVFAFNRINSYAGPCDIGFGTCGGEHPDWTFAHNAGDYRARRLSVWVK